MTDLLDRPADLLRLEPLTSTIGAVVHDVDLGDVEDPTVVEALRGALLRWRVLFFRGQHLTPAEQVRVARWLGEPTPAHPLAGGLDADHPEVLILDSSSYALGLGRRNERTSYNDCWHTDVTFSATPPAAAVLCAEVIPASGGDTLWADAVDAYETLTAPIRALLDPLRATHTAQQAFSFLAADDAGRAALSELDSVSHPVVRVHPETGERALFVNPAFTTSIEGLSERESEALLGLLFAHTTAPERTVRWRWEAGDVAIWDNQVTQHFACADYGDAHRRMRRVTVRGDRPFGPADAATAPTA